MTGIGLAAQQLSAIPDPPRTADPSPAERFGLTERELEVLRLVAAGHSDREIADALFISPRTVGVHVSRLLAKLGVPSRAAATALAMRHRLV
jgi:DNA-binding CsgD family transcriptional regulator